MSEYFIKPKNKEEEKLVKAFLKKNKIDFREIEKYSVVEEEEAVYKTSKSPRKETKQKLMSEIKEAVKEMNMVKKGKIKARSAKDLLDEL